MRQGTRTPRPGRSGQKPTAMCLQGCRQRIHQEAGAGRSRLQRLQQPSLRWTTAKLDTQATRNVDDHDYSWEDRRGHAPGHERSALLVRPLVALRTHPDSTCHERDAQRADRHRLVALRRRLCAVVCRLCARSSRSPPPVMSRSTGRPAPAPARLVCWRASSVPDGVADHCPPQSTGGATARFMRSADRGQREACLGVGERGCT
jgi:hypothetical protein